MRWMNVLWFLGFILGALEHSDAVITPAALVVAVLASICYLFYYKDWLLICNFVKFLKYRRGKLSYCYKK